MGSLFLSLLGALRSALRTRADLVIENLALRQQLANFQRTSGRSLSRSSRLFGTCHVGSPSHGDGMISRLGIRSKIDSPSPTSPTRSHAPRLG